MKVVLKSMKIENFKGIRKQSLSFSPVTNIFGANNAGKTSIVDAFLWLFFGKNSEGKAAFAIKPQDGNGADVNNLETIVEASILIDGQETVVKKIYSEEWVTRRGDTVPYLKGHKNEYYWNEVPVSTEREFKARVDGIMPENLFKLITSPYAFNSLDWTKRRAELLHIAGEVSNDEIYAQVGDLHPDVRAAIERGETLDNIKKALGSKIAKLKEDKESIPARIDEAEKSKPSKVDEKEIDEMISEYKKEIAAIESEIEDKSKAYNAEAEKIQEKQKQVHSLKMELLKIESDIEAKQKSASTQAGAKVRDFEREIQGLVEAVQSDKRKVANWLDQVALKSKRQDELRQQFHQVDGEKFPGIGEEECNCPTCKQSLPADRIEELRFTMEANFNKNKAAKLDQIRKEGTTLKTEVEELQSSIAKTEKVIAADDEKVTGLQYQLKSAREAMQRAISEQVELPVLFSSDPAWTEKNQQIDDLKKEIDAKAVPTIDEEWLSGRKSRKNILSDEILQLAAKKGAGEQIEKINARISELKENESRIASEIAKLQGQQFAVEAFNKAKMETVERRVNGLFKSVRFRMFSAQINGGEAETCECLVNTNGSFVPFDSANQAGKVNAGIDIINVLCKHYERYAPIFIDQRESVTELMPTESQVINLFVSPKDKTIRVEATELIKEGLFA